LDRFAIACAKRSQPALRGLPRVVEGAHANLLSVTPGVRLCQAGRRFELSVEPDGWEETPLPRTGGAPARAGAQCGEVSARCQRAGKSLLTDALSIQTAPLWMAGHTTGVAQFQCVSSRTTWIIDPCVASGALTAVPSGIAPRSLHTTASRSAVVYGIVFGAVTTGR